MISHYAHACRAIVGERENQEDAHGFAVLDATGDAGMFVAVVADGMGGHAAGEVASRIAVDTFLSELQDDATGDRRLAALEAANNAILARVEADPERDGMGCTLVAAIIDSVGLRWVSVGDSLLYLFRDRKLSRLNEDHSMAPVLDDLAERGLMDRMEARTSARRHYLRSALTGRDIDMIDAPSNAVPMVPGDWIVLATDGIEVLANGTIEAILTKHVGGSADQMAEALLDAVRDRQEPHQDNTTVFVLQARSDEATDATSQTVPLTRRS